jgi:hypothetical protein
MLSRLSIVQSTRFSPLRGLRTSAASAPSLRFELQSSDTAMRDGLEVDYRSAALGIPVGWRSRIADYDPARVPGHQLKGPYRSWAATPSWPGNRTHHDVVDYSMPLGPTTGARGGCSRGSWRDLPVRPAPFNRFRAPALTGPDVAVAGGAICGRRNRRGLAATASWSSLAGESARGPYRTASDQDADAAAAMGGCCPDRRRRAGYRSPSRTRRSNRRRAADLHADRRRRH